ncbi:MAG: hypothetical protein U0359_22640 [Byssovorax sp.]
MLAAELADVGLYGSIPRFGDLCIHAAVDARRAYTRADLERAVEAVIQAFPVFGCRYQKGLFRDRWARVDGPVSDAVHIVDAPDDLEAATLRWVHTKIQPDRDRPLRVVSFNAPDGRSRLLLSVMHLAVDGAGMAAVGQVFGAALYGLPPMLPVDPRRGLHTVLDRLRAYHLPVLAKDILSVLAQPLFVLAAGKRERPYPAAEKGPSIRHLTISAADLATLKARVRPHKISVNDLLIASLARAASRRSSRGKLVVLYTMDLRRYAASPRLSAANTSSILTALVPRDAVHSLESAARAVADITARHRRSFIGPAFVLTPMLLTGATPHALVRRMLFGVHRVAVDLPVSRGLFVTNVGKIDEGLGPFGDDIEQIRVLGPNIEGLPIPGIVAYGFRGGLHLELYVPPGLAPEAGDELAAEVLAGLDLNDPAAA